MSGEPPAKRPSGLPLSPCLKVCQMDDERRYCLGCQRTLAEIAEWWKFDDAQKHAVLAALPDRRLQARRIRS